MAIFVTMKGEPILSNQTVKVAKGDLRDNSIVIDVFVDGDIIRVYRLAPMVYEADREGCILNSAELENAVLQMALAGEVLA